MLLWRATLAAGRCEDGRWEDSEQRHRPQLALIGFIVAGLSGVALLQVVFRSD